jgi:hypothetical protein
MTSFSDRRKVSHFFAAALVRLKARWRQWVAPDRYRPEKHYMRGPGPKTSGLKNSCLENSGKAGGGNSPAS